VEGSDPFARVVSHIKPLVDFWSTSIYRGYTELVLLELIEEHPACLRLSARATSTNIPIIGLILVCRKEGVRLSVYDIDRALARYSATNQRFLRALVEHLSVGLNIEALAQLQADANSQITGALADFTLNACILLQALGLAVLHDIASHLPVSGPEMNR
jgi:hypothetical protein